MLLFGLRKSDRLRVEAFVGLLLALITIAFPMMWWLKTALVFVLAAILIHLIFSSSITIGFKTVSKVGISVLAIAVIASIIWNPIQNIEIIQGLKNIPGLLSGLAKTNESLRSETGSLVKQLREFQKKIDDWRNVESRLDQDVKNAKSNDESRKLLTEGAQKLTTSMVSFDKQFNNDLKPQVIAIKSRLLSRLPPKSVPPKPTVDWTLQYGFSTFPNAVGDMADYLESLAAMLPEK